MTWKIMTAWLAIMLKSLLRGEVLTGWFLLSKGPVRTWLPFPRCLDEWCPERHVYLLHVWAWSLKTLAKEPSTWIEYREDRPMTIEQIRRGEFCNVTISMPAPTVHVDRPWAIRRWEVGT